MKIIKYALQKLNILKKSQPDLYDTIRINFEECNETTKGKIAGIIIEYVIKAGGDVSIFQDTLDLNIARNEVFLDNFNDEL